MTESWWESPDPELVAARNDAGRAVRDIGHALVGHHASVELIREVAATLDGLTARLSEGERRSRPMGSFTVRGTWRGTPGEGEPFTTFEDRPISGVASPFSCELDSVREGDEAVVRFTLRSAHEGAPGRSHGGFVSAIFDDVMGFVIQMLETPAYTGELTVRYEAGVPVGKPLVMRARLDHVNGRKIHITADLWDGEQRLATAKSTFIAIPSLPD